MMQHDPPGMGMGMGMGMDGGMGGMGGMGMMGGMSDTITIPRARYLQIKERFNERDLELKQAHLQIQLMQLQLEKLEAENKMLKQTSMGSVVRRNTGNLFDL